VSGVIVLEQCALYGYDLVAAPEAGRDIGFVVVMRGCGQAIMMLSLDDSAEAGGVRAGGWRAWLPSLLAPMDPMGGRAARFWRIGVLALAEVTRTDPGFALWVNGLRIGKTMSLAEQAIAAGLGPYAGLLGRAARSGLAFGALARGASGLMPDLAGRFDSAARLADVLIRPGFERQARDLLALLPPPRG